MSTGKIKWTCTSATSEMDATGIKVIVEGIRADSNPKGELTRLLNDSSPQHNTSLENKLAPPIQASIRAWVHLWKCQKWSGKI